MDLKQFAELSEALCASGYEISPKPKKDENLSFFDIISEGAEIPVASVMNAISLVMPDVRLAAAQSHRMTCEDITA